MDFVHGEHGDSCCGSKNPSSHVEFAGCHSPRNIAMDRKSLITIKTMVFYTSFLKLINVTAEEWEFEKGTTIRGECNFNIHIVDCRLEDNSDHHLLLRSNESDWIEYNNRAHEEVFIIFDIYIYIKNHIAINHYEPLIMLRY